MKKVLIQLTKKQVMELQTARKGMSEFALLAQPVISREEMSVLVLTVREFNKIAKFIKTFVPKELRGSIDG